MKNEPVLLLAAVAAVVVSAAAKLHIALTTDLVETLILDGGLLVTAIVQRGKVTPAKTR